MDGVNIVDIGLIAISFTQLMYLKYCILGVCECVSFTVFSHKEYYLSFIT